MSGNLSWYNSYMKKPGEQNQLLAGFATGVNKELITPTPEQQAIINNPLTDIVIRAFAGTGKTATLLQYTAQNANKKFLYLAFNNSISKEAQKKFPSNVTAQTTHSLAHEFIGTEKYRKKFTPALKPLNFIGLAENLAQASVIQNTIKKFCLSAARAINESHLPKNKIKELVAAAQGDESATRKNAALQEEFNKYIKESRAAWEKIINPEVKSIKIDHEVYLKLLALNCPQEVFASYDGVLVDEAQDSNEVTAELIKNTGKPVIVVGDSHQAIYGFRGAWNALGSFTGAQYVLSESFRFGGPNCSGRQYLNNPHDQGEKSFAWER